MQTLRSYFTSATEQRRALEAVGDFFIAEELDPVARAMARDDAYYKRLEKREQLKRDQSLLSEANGRQPTPDKQ